MLQGYGNLMQWRHKKKRNTICLTRVHKMRNSNGPWRLCLDNEQRQRVDTPVRQFINNSEIIVSRYYHNNVTMYILGCRAIYL